MVSVLRPGFPGLSISDTFRQLLPEHFHLLIQPSKHLLCQPRGLRAHLEEQDRLVPDVVEVLVFKLQIVRRVFGHDYIRFLSAI